ncbi:MAG: amino acid ABC transporter substrate-binding protein [Burkholderiales bacterium]|nr:amino acid ABC transporter substrate-binding protein [Burkholderiales bacterium]
MKLLSAIFFMALLLTACGEKESAMTKPAQPQVSPSPAVTTTTKIVVGFDDSFPPMGFRDEQSQIVGFDIDMAREAMRRMGGEVEFKAIDWNAKEAELNSKRIDLLWNGLTITEERKKKINFTAPYMNNSQIIIVLANSPIKSKMDMKGRTVGVQDGSSAVEAVEKETEIVAALKELKKYGDNVTALMDLNVGRIDAIVIDEVVGRYYTTKRPGEYIVLEDNLGSEEYGVGLRKEDTELLAKLEKTLNEMKADGTASKIAIQWFGADIIK